MNEIILNKSRLKTFRNFILGLLFVGVGAFLLMIEQSYRIKLVGIFLIVLFGYVSYQYWLHILKKHPVLIINHEGIIDNTPVLGVGPISWDEIEIITLEKIAYTYFLDIYLVDYKEYLSRITLGRRIIANLNSRFGYSKILINLSTIDKDPKKIFQLIVEACPKNHEKKLMA